MTRLLVIRPGAIGDSLLAFPVLQALREQYEDNVHIIFVSNAAILPLAKAWKLADEVFDYDNMLWSELFYPEIKPEQRIYTLLQTIDIAICWLRDSEHRVQQNLYTAGIKHVVIALGRPPADGRIHIVDYLFQTLAMSTKKSYESLKLPLSLAQSEEKRTIAVHQGSGGAQKCWPVSSFATLIKELWRANLPVLLLAGPADHERLEELLVLLQSPPHPLPTKVVGNGASQTVVGTPLTASAGDLSHEIKDDILGSLPINRLMDAVNGVPTTWGVFNVLLDVPLLELAQHLQQCRAYIGNDSGITHLAALLGVPTLALFGPSDPAIWHPVGPSVHVLYEPQLQNLRVDTVVDTMKSILLK